MQTSEGVVLAVEKRVSSTLLEASSIEKIMEIDEHLGCAVSGMTADARTMIEHARVAAQVIKYYGGTWTFFYENSVLIIILLLTEP